MKTKTIIVIGGGPGGMMSAYAAAKNGHHVVLLEKNVRLGKKMLITGKGRCNVTNDAPVNELVKAMVGNGKFLYGAFSDFSSEDTMAWFTDGGVPLKVERGQRVFPVSDISGDIVGCMERQLAKVGVEVKSQTTAGKIIVQDGVAVGVKADGRIINADAVVIATGGVSYPRTGSTGDGYKLAQNVGHTIKPVFPALVPLVVKESYVGDLEGLSLRNAEISIKSNGKVLGKDFGEMVFTDVGMSGPVILTLSRICAKHFSEQPHEPLDLTINLKPALTEEQLDLRLQRDYDSYPKRNYSTLLQELLPKKMIPVFVQLSQIDPWKQGNQINKQDRKVILKLLRALPFTVVKCRPIEEAIITAGGVNVKEIDPKTMGSKKIHGLFFAGEVIDIDGVTGGFNIQAALSTGYRSGLGAANYLTEMDE
ncbi:MAG: NAD(P)/FAD-dependent oxidoreductase [Clostridiales bacterium]